MKLRHDGQYGMARLLLGFVGAIPVCGPLVDLEVWEAKEGTAAVKDAGGEGADVTSHVIDELDGHDNPPGGH